MRYHLSNVSRVVRDVSNALYDIAGQYITWPSKDVQMNRIKTSFYDIVHFPGVVGAIDCTHVRIQAPPLNYEYAFVNRKWYYSTNVHRVCVITQVIYNLRLFSPPFPFDTYSMKYIQVFKYILQES